MENYINTQNYETNHQDATVKKYSVFVHLFFGFIILGFLGIFSLIFKETIINVMFHFPIFSYSFLCCMGWGFLYYVYKIIHLRIFVATQEKLLALKAVYLDKKIDLFNLMQIIIAGIGIVTLINTVFGMIDTARNTPVFGDYDMVLYPLYIILICLIGISVLIILSLRINEIIYDLYLDNPVILNNPIYTIPPHKGNLMSDTILTNTPEETTQDSVSETLNIPSYDNGFLYKKLFELNDNVQDIQRHILIGHNDNISNNVIQTLWDTKIYPFLNNISERIKAIETKLEISTIASPKLEIPVVDNQAIPVTPILNADIVPQENDISKLWEKDISIDTNTNTNTHITDNQPITLNSDNNLKNIITPTHIDDDFIKLSPKFIPDISVKPADNTFNTVTENAEKIIIPVTVTNPASDIKKLHDTEETFIHVNTNSQINITEANTATQEQEISVSNPVQSGISVIQATIKDKTLEELSKFLEDKMKELYDNNVAKGRFIKTEAV